MGSQRERGGWCCTRGWLLGLGGVLGGTMLLPLEHADGAGRRRDKYSCLQGPRVIGFLLRSISFLRQNAITGRPQTQACEDKATKERLFWFLGVGPFISSLGCGLASPASLCPAEHSTRHCPAPNPPVAPVTYEIEPELFEVA